eukprot:1154431-Pelagomonas_calceolata.AAC.4
MSVLLDASVQTLVPSIWPQQWLLGLSSVHFMRAGNSLFPREHDCDVKHYFQMQPAAAPS